MVAPGDTYIHFELIIMILSFVVQPLFPIKQVPYLKDMMNKYLEEQKFLQLTLVKLMISHAFITWWSLCCVVEN